MKKEYKTPLVSVLLTEPEPLMDPASTFVSTEGNQDITGSKDEYNDEFQSRHQSIWDED